MRHPMMAAGLVLAGALTLTAAAAQSAPPAAGDTDPVVLASDGFQVTRSQVEQALRALIPGQRRQVEASHDQLDQFVYQLYIQLRMQQAAERQGLQHSPQVQAKLAQTRRQALASALVDRYRAGLKRPDFTALAKEYYQAHPDQFRLPERLRVAHILLRVQCPCEDQAKHQLAEKLLAELHHGADFAKLASQYSDDAQSKDQGGKLDQWVTRQDVVPAFAKAAFALATPGAISGVVKSRYGYHIIKLLAREPAHVQPFKTVRGKIVKQLWDNYRQSTLQAFSQRFQPGADARIDRQVLQALVKPEPDNPGS